MRGILLQPKVFGIRQTYLAIFSDKTWNKKVISLTCSLALLLPGYSLTRESSRQTTIKYKLVGKGEITSAVAINFKLNTNFYKNINSILQDQILPPIFNL